MQHDSRYFAMKIISKRMLSKNAATDILTERQILLKLHHPFIITLRASFQTPSKLYICMDFAEGGELFHHLSKQVRETRRSAGEKPNP